MTTQTEALKLALEALIGARAFLESDTPVEIWSLNDKAITAITEALANHIEDNITMVAQPAVAEQHKQSTTCGEPVAWMEGESVYWHTNPSLNDWIRANGTPLYTTPPQRPSRSDIKPLTDTERDSMVDSYDSGLMEKFWYLKGIDDTEAAHGICPTDFKE